MIVQGSANPLSIWIRYIDENNNAIIKLTRNVTNKEIPINGTEEIITQYEYEEVDLKMPNRDNLDQYIQNNFDLLFEKGLNDMELEKQLQEKDKQIKELINNYKLLDVNQQTQDILNSLNQLTDMYGETLDSIMFDILPNLNN